MHVCRVGLMGQQCPLLVVHLEATTRLARGAGGDSNHQGALLTSPPGTWQLWTLQQAGNLMESTALVEIPLLEAVGTRAEQNGGPG